MCNRCNWESSLDLSEELMNDSDYEFAIDTVENIHDWIEENEHVTDAQQEALSNIYGSITDD